MTYIEPIQRPGRVRRLFFVVWSTYSASLDSDREEGPLDEDAAKSRALTLLSCPHVYSVGVVEYVKRCTLTPNVDWEDEEAR